MASVLQLPRTQTVQRSRSTHLKLAIAGTILLGAVAFLVFSSFQSNTVYYYTLQEMNSKRTELMGQTVRVNGPLDKSSIQNDEKNLVLRFNIKDKNLVMPVVYHGVPPDTLGTGESVVAEGKLDANGVFQANTILVKCPSKYESATVQPGVNQ